MYILTCTHLYSLISYVRDVVFQKSNHTWNTVISVNDKHVPVVLDWSLKEDKAHAEAVHVGHEEATLVSQHRVQRMLTGRLAVGIRKVRVFSDVMQTWYKIIMRIMSVCSRNHFRACLIHDTGWRKCGSSWFHARNDCTYAYFGFLEAMLCGQRSAPSSFVMSNACSSHIKGWHKYYFHGVSCSRDTMVYLKCRKNVLSQKDSPLCALIIGYEHARQFSNDTDSKMHLSTQHSHKPYQTHLRSFCMWVCER